MMKRVTHRRKPRNRKPARSKKADARSAPLPAAWASRIDARKVRLLRKTIRLLFEDSVVRFVRFMLPGQQLTLGEAALLKKLLK